MRNSLFVAALFAVLLPALPAQQGWTNPFDYPFGGGAGPDSFYGSSGAPVGDVDHDGVIDFAISAPGTDHQGLIACGAVYVYSGNDGSLLPNYPIYGDSHIADFGRTIVGITRPRPVTGEEDKPFMVVGQPYYGSTLGSATGRVKSYDLDTGVFIDELTGYAQGDLFGFSLAEIDWDGRDDTSEIAIGIPGTGFSSMVGSVEIYDVTDGVFTFITSFSGRVSQNDMFGTAVSSIPSVFANDPSNLLVGASNAENNMVTPALPIAGAIHVYSPFSPTALMSVYGDISGGQLGWSVASTHSLLPPASVEFSAGAPGGRGYVLTWDGASLVPYARIEGQGVDDQMGYSICMIPDTDYNGYNELVVGSPGFNNKDGKVEIFDFRSSTPSTTYSATTTKAHLGYCVAPLGSGESARPQPLLIGAPSFNEERGIAVVTAPPGIVLSLSNYEPRISEPFTLDVSGAQPYAYLEFRIVPDQSLGFEWADANGEVSFSYSDNDPTHVGVTFTFEVEDVSTGKLSNLENATMQAPADYTLDVIGSVAAGGSIQLEASYGTPNTNQYFFYSLNGPGNGKANIAIGTGNYDIDTGLTNPVAFMATPMKTSDSNGYTLTATQGIPGNAAGLSVWFSVIDAAAYNAAPYARTGEFVVQ